MEEEWRQVPSVPEISASSWGRVLVAPSQAKMPHGGLRWYKPEPTYGYEEKTATGRPGVGKRKILRVGRLKRTFKIARLVCEAFHGPPLFPRAVTIHLDEDPTNNRAENLKWGTQKENLNMPKFKEWQKTIRGNNHPCVKYTDELVMEMKRRSMSGERIVDFAKEYGISPDMVSAILSNRGNNLKA